MSRRPLCLALASAVIGVLLVSGCDIAPNASNTSKPTLTTIVGEGAMRPFAVEWELLDLPARAAPPRLASAVVHVEDDAVLSAKLVTLADGASHLVATGQRPGRTFVHLAGEVDGVAVSATLDAIVVAPDALDQSLRGRSVDNGIVGDVPYDAAILARYRGADVGFVLPACVEGDVEIEPLLDGRYRLRARREGWAKLVARAGDVVLELRVPVLAEGEIEELKIKDLDGGFLPRTPGAGEDVFEVTVARGGALWLRTFVAGSQGRVLYGALDARFRPGACDAAACSGEIEIDDKDPNGLTFFGVRPGRTELLARVNGRPQRLVIHVEAP